MYDKKPEGYISQIHNFCLKTDIEIIKWSFMKLRYKYTSFYKENLEIKKLENYLCECNIQNQNRFSIGRYFNSLEYYLKYLHKASKNINSQKSVLPVKSK
jgi:hypothetical protein